MTRSDVFPESPSPETSAGARRWYVVLGTLVVLALLMTGIGYAIDPQWRVERRQRIEAPPEAVLPYLVSPRRHVRWLGWDDSQDPTLVRRYEGPTEGPGATVIWNGNRLGSGWLRIEAIDPTPEGGTVVRWRQELFGRIPTQGEVRVLPTSGGGSEVVARSVGTLPRPHGPFFRGPTERQLGAHLKTALERLAALAEGRPAS